MKWFFLLLLASHPLFAAGKNFSEERENYFTTSTPYSIEPQVNPLSGDLMLDEVDFAVAGVEPISLRRFYNHTAPYEARSGGWRLNPETFAVANLTLKNQDRFVAVGNKSGSIVSLSESQKSYRYAPKGAMHFQPGGQSHPLNLKIDYREKRAHKKNFFAIEGEITDGTGAIRHFRSPKHCWRSEVEVPFTRKANVVLPPEVWVPYQLPVYEERRPNGNIIKYEYKGWKENGLYPRPFLLKGVITYNSDKSKVLGWLDFDYFQDKDETVRGIRVRGSDGRWVCLGNRTFDAELLHLVEAPDRPNTWYDYQHLSINKVDYPEGRYIRTEYNGQNKVAAQYAPLGPNGEEHPLARYIYHATATEILDAENQKTIYHFDQNQQIIAHEVYNQDGTYLKSEKYFWDQTTGNLLKKVVEDGTGKPLLITEYQYDHNQNPIVEKIGDGQKWHTVYRTFSSDGFNLLLSESDRPGKITQYRYKPGTNLRTEELVLEGARIKKRAFYFYDDTACCVKTIVDDGSHENPYDLAGVSYRKILEIIPRQQHPCFGLPEIVLEKTIDETGAEIVLKKVVYTYAPSGKIVQEDHYDQEGNYCYCLKNTYDSKERLIATQDAEENITSFEYDANHNLTSISALHEEKICYDRVNRPIKYLTQHEDSWLEKTKNYDRLGRVVSETDFCNNTTYFTYNVLGLPIKIEHPDGAIEYKEYDVFGNLTAEIDALGYTTTTLYDFRNKPTCIFYPDGTNESFTYSDWGALVTHTTREGLLETFEYDIFDNVTRLCVYDQKGTLLKCQSSVYTPFCKIKEVSPEGTLTLYSYDYAGRKIQEKRGDQEVCYGYDTLGRLSVTCTEDTESIQKYDFNNRLIEQSTICNSHVLLSQSYRYDPMGNCTQKINAEGTSFTTYNSQKLPTSITDALGNTTTFSYSYKGGFQEIITRPHGVQEIKRYNSRNLLSQLLKVDSAGHVLQQTDYTYDRVGSCLTTTHLLNQNQTITHHREYDSCRRLTQLIEAEQKTTRYFYDLYGRLSTTLKPSGQTLNHEYDALGRLHRFYGKGFDYTYCYNKEDVLLEVYDAISHTTTSRSYDIYGQLTEELLGNGLKLTNTYDTQGRRVKQHLPDGSSINYSYEGPFLKQITRGSYTHRYLERNQNGLITKAALASNLGELSYQYDALGRVEKIHSPFYTQHNRYDSESNLIYSCKNGEELWFDYDALDQLIQEKDHSYNYDNLHNRTSKDGASYDINALCQVLSDNTTHYKYDADGNLIFDGTSHYVYDALDRLIGLNDTAFTYDSFHRRLSQTTDKKTIYYLWDGDNEIGAAEEGALTQLRILGEGLGAEIGAAVLLELNGTPYVPIHDTQGSLIVLINLLTKKPCSYSYTAFGEQLSGTTVSPWRFASKRTEQGLIYFGRRYYNPTLGRFITQDPEGFHDGPNLYAYVHNRPLTHFDLYGLFDLDTHTDLMGFGDLSYGSQVALGRVKPEFFGYENNSRFKSELYDLSDAGYPDMPYGGAATFCNGMQNSLSDFKMSLNYLSDLSGGYSMAGCYNASNGFLTDGSEYCMNRFRKISTTPVSFLHEMWDYRLSKMTAPYMLHFCHSQGVALTKRALETYPVDKRNKIRVIAIAPGEFIDKKTCHSVQHYVSWDGVPYLDPINRFRYRDTIKYVPSKTPWYHIMDHSFLSPTYREPIRTRNGRLYKRY